MATLDDLNNASLPLNGDEFIHTRRALEDKVVTVDQMFEDRLGVFKTRNNTITLAEAVASTKANAGDIVIVSDRGNGLFEYKTDQIPNGDTIIACTVVPSLSLVYQVSDANTVYSISALATVKGALQGQVVYLSAGGRSGTFVWDSSDLSTETSADTQQGIYVAPESDNTGASGAWVRETKFGEDYPIEWCGISPGASVDISEAISSLLPLAILNGSKITLPYGNFNYNGSGSWLGSKGLKGVLTNDDATSTVINRDNLTQNRPLITADGGEFSNLVLGTSVSAFSFGFGDCFIGQAKGVTVETAPKIRDIRADWTTGIRPYAFVYLANNTHSNDNGATYNGYPTIRDFEFKHVHIKGGQAFYLNNSDLIIDADFFTVDNSNVLSTLTWSSCWAVNTLPGIDYDMPSGRVTNFKYKAPQDLSATFSGYDIAQSGNLVIENFELDFSGSSNNLTGQMIHKEVIRDGISVISRNGSVIGNSLTYGAYNIISSGRIEYDNVTIDSATTCFADTDTACTNIIANNCTAKNSVDGFLRLDGGSNNRCENISGVAVSGNLTDTTVVDTDGAPFQISSSAEPATPRNTRILSSTVRRLYPSAGSATGNVPSLSFDGYSAFLRLRNDDVVAFTDYKLLGVRDYSSFKVDIHIRYGGGVFPLTVIQLLVDCVYSAGTFTLTPLKGSLVGSEYQLHTLGNELLLDFTAADADYVDMSVKISGHIMNEIS